ncbi:acyltransferase family protein [Klebsiella quasivariicola]|uniref:acyltransferase family protein n=1 Tax=Klebsiella quasivariicola TaxID=2026240 RepID=UPI00247B0375|nr:acyltransferase [Klebsiella quasivariicola]
MSGKFFRANTDKHIYSLNSLKIILSIMVVFIHTRIFLDNSVLLDTITSNGFFRIAVPVFFIMNGYFLPSTKSSFKRWFIKSVSIYLSLTILYSFSWLNLSTKLTAVKTTAYALLMGYSHLWYIQAMIISGVIIFLLKNNISLLVLSIFLFFFGAFFQVYASYQHAINPDLPLRYSLYRNAFTVGLPFMVIGYLFRKKELSIPQKTINKIGLLAVLLFSIEIAINYIKFTSPLSKPTSFDIYFSLILLCPIIFIIFKNMKVGININKNLPNYIYFFHPIPILLLKEKLSSMNNIKYSLLIIVITLFISLTVMGMAKLAKNKGVLLFPFNR